LSDDRWSRTAARLGELEESRRDAFTETVRAFVQPHGDEHVLDVGTGSGALAFALARYVADVLGVDDAPALLEEARRRGGAFPNVSFVEGDATDLDIVRGTFDLAGCSRVLHHVHRPEMVVASLSRATRFGGHVLVIDQIAPKTDQLSQLLSERILRHILRQELPMALDQLTGQLTVQRIALAATGPDHFPKAGHALRINQVDFQKGVVEEDRQ